MKRSLWKLAAAAFGALVIWGCSSIPQKAASDESLVVIKTEFINPLNLRRSFEMAFNYSGDYPASWVGQYSWDFNIVPIKEPGVRLKSVGPRISAGFRGDAKNFDVDFVLPYEPGRVVIADFVFVQTLEKTGENSYMNRWSFRTIKPQEKEEMMKALKADGRFATWMKEGE